MTLLQTTQTKPEENPLRQIRVEKVTVNIATGKSGDPLEKAKKVLNQLTSQTPATKRAKNTIKDFGIRKGEPIAAIVTLRRDEANSFLTRAWMLSITRLRNPPSTATAIFLSGYESISRFPAPSMCPS